MTSHTDTPTNVRVRSGLVLGALVLLAFARFEMWSTLLVVATIVGLGEIVSHRRRMVGKLFVAIFAGAYSVIITCGLLFGILLYTSSAKILWIGVTVVTTVATDVCGRAVGKKFGKPETFFRAVSPNKSFVGFIGAWVGGAIAGGIVLIGARSALADFPIETGATLIISLPLIAIAGDLIASQLKRKLGIKDFGSWIPGHGGLNDRLDSIAPSALWTGTVAMTSVTVWHVLFAVVLAAVLIQEGSRVEA